MLNFIFTLMATATLLASAPQVIPDYIYKVMTESDWNESKQSTTLKNSPYDTAFIHLCSQEQINAIATKFFSKEKQVVILKIDPKKLSGRLVKEKNPGGSTEYFHLYEATIPLSAVASFEPLPLSGR